MYVSCTSCSRCPSSRRCALTLAMMSSWCVDISWKSCKISIISGVLYSALYWSRFRRSCAGVWLRGSRPDASEPACRMSVAKCMSCTMWCRFALSDGGPSGSSFAPFTLFGLWKFRSARLMDRCAASAAPSSFCRRLRVRGVTCSGAAAAPPLPPPAMNTIFMASSESIVELACCFSRATFSAICASYSAVGVGVCMRFSMAAAPLSQGLAAAALSASYAYLITPHRLRASEGSNSFRNPCVEGTLSGPAQSRATHSGWRSQRSMR
mmetsp:Transcript_9676/g.28404  ORF Transcript_9676/g.28404 Transcript_9676/m.28404 type:complete len:266 (+) Transcript_9676:1983-2780(+)